MSLTDHCSDVWLPITPLTRWLVSLEADNRLWEQCPTLLAVGLAPLGGVISNSLPQASGLARQLGDFCGRVFDLPGPVACS